MKGVLKKTFEKNKIWEFWGVSLCRKFWKKGPFAIFNIRFFCKRSKKLKGGFIGGHLKNFEKKSHKAVNSHSAGKNENLLLRNTKPLGWWANILPLDNERVKCATCRVKWESCRAEKKAPALSHNTCKGNQKILQTGHPSHKILRAPPPEIHRPGNAINCKMR